MHGSHSEGANGSGTLLSNEQARLLGPAINLITRMRDHVERLDEGAVHAVDDLAVTLRALLCSGRGNNVLLRLASAFATSAVVLSHAPRFDHEIHISYGAIPTVEEGALADGGTLVPLNQWLQRQVIARQTAKPGHPERRIETFTWDNFISDYANKWGGSHVDVDVPEYLHTVDAHAAAGMHLPAYMLRAAALQTWRTAREIYLQIWKEVGEPGAMASAVPVSAGGRTSDPRDRSSRGEVQWFSRTAGELTFLCYVPDEAAEEVSFVFWPYSFQYGEQSATPAAGPRKAGPPHPTSWGKGPPLIARGQFKRFSQVRGTVLDGGPDD